MAISTDRERVFLNPSFSLGLKEFIANEISNEKGVSFFAGKGRISLCKAKKVKIKTQKQKTGIKMVRALAFISPTSYFFFSANIVQLFFCLLQSWSFEFLVSDTSFWKWYFLYQNERAFPLGTNYSLLYFCGNSFKLFLNVMFWR